MFSVDADGSDRLTINGLGGDDAIDASGLEAGAVQLTINGGLGDDMFLGSEGDDQFNGGDGNDTALMGAGDDTFVWNPGDDNDTLEGQDGFDTMLFNGAGIAENIDILANGGRALFTRDIANVTMDSNDVERIDFQRARRRRQHHRARSLRHRRDRGEHQSRRARSAVLRATGRRTPSRRAAPTATMLRCCSATRPASAFSAWLRRSTSRARKSRTTGSSSRDSPATT